MTALSSRRVDSSKRDGERGEDPRAEERSLVERAIERDRSAFAELYDRHVVRVYRHIYYLVNDRGDAEDLTAQTFLKAWEAIDRYRERGAPFVSWLLRIAHNVAVSFLRARREHGTLEDYVIDPKRHGNPEEALEQSSDEDSIRRAILELREEQRQVIILRFVEELDHREVAAVIGKSVPAVRVIQHRALGNLRKLMRA
jgi:RNA polymerase sigma-70 factor, ECF subfamily